MKVLLVNKFLFPKGGDAISTLKTGKLLSGNGHEVFYWGMEHPANPDYPYSEHFVSNVDYEGDLSLTQKMSNSFKILYSLEAKRKIEKFIKIIRPDIVHLHNFAHQISPSILDVLTRYKIPAVITMHDYKMVCPSYTMLSNGKPCEKCKNGRYYWCFIKKCTKDSSVKSLINVIEMYLHHKILHIYDGIDIFISPSLFLKNKLREMGFKQKIEHLFNFLDTKDYLPEFDCEDKTICYLGRLSKEKGLFTLLEAIKGIDTELKIIGDGPIREDLEEKVKKENLKNVAFLGYKSGSELKEEIRKSMGLILPSECYENNPIAVLEAFALGKPVIGARIGGIPELVKDGETGFTFEPGNVVDLRNKILTFINDKDRIPIMGKRARKFVEENFNSEKHYQKLMKIYKMAIKKRLA
jgi:glycosyltransferase involved in cell wall biosynthesis